jgi:hypothetical protein
MRRLRQRIEPTYQGLRPANPGDGVPKDPTITPTLDHRSGPSRIVAHAIADASSAAPPRTPRPHPDHRPAPRHDRTLPTRTPLQRSPAAPHSGPGRSPTTAPPPHDNEDRRRLAPRPVRRARARVSALSHEVRPLSGTHRGEVCPAAVDAGATDTRATASVVDRGGFVPTWLRCSRPMQPRPSPPEGPHRRDSPQRRARSSRPCEGSSKTGAGPTSR